MNISILLLVMTSMLRAEAVDAGRGRGRGDDGFDDIMTTQKEKHRRDARVLKGKASKASGSKSSKSKDFHSSTGCKAFNGYWEAISVDGRTLRTSIRCNNGEIHTY